MAIEVKVKTAGLIFDLARHYYGPLCKNNHRVGPSIQSLRYRKTRACVSCVRESQDRYKANHPDKVKALDAKRYHRTIKGSDRKVRDPFGYYLTNVRTRGRVKGIDVELTTNDIRRLWLIQDGKCYWTDTPLDFFTGDRGKRHPLRPSLDRLEPGGPYSFENCVWTTQFANSARSDLPATEFASIMKGFGFSGQYLKHYP